jgi:hypothetical protein
LDAHFGAVELHVPREGDTDLENLDDSQKGDEKSPWLSVELDGLVARIDLRSWVSRPFSFFFLFQLIGLRSFVEHFKRRQLA